MEVVDAVDGVVVVGDVLFGPNAPPPGVGDEYLLIVGGALSHGIGNDLPMEVMADAAKHIVSAQLIGEVWSG